MPSRDKRSADAMTDVQRLFGDDGDPPPPSSEEREEEEESRDAEESRMLARIRDRIADDAPAPPPPTPRKLVEVTDGPPWIDLRGADASIVLHWWESLRSPPKPELVGAYTALLVATLVGSRSIDGWVRTDDLFELLPRTVVDEGLRRLRYTGHLFLNADGRFRVVQTPTALTSSTQEQAA
jgi:hypothetical protein